MARSSSRLRALAIAGALAWAGPGIAQQTPPAAKSGVDAGAMAALDKMGAYLRTLRVFRVETRTTRDEVLANGQKIQREGTVDMLVRRPDGLRARVKSDLQDRMFFYDGKTFTLYGMRVGYYAQAAAPPTLGELADVLDEKYDIEIPLADLFLWGTDKAAVNQIRSAVDVGPSEVDGTSCEQYAFRQEGLDWQVWLQQGKNPLPRKLVLTTLDDDARPEYSSTLRWDLAPAYDDAAFTFDPPSDAKRIVFAADRTGAGR
jgi:hypothetical protein